jgi:hypothetical protein
MLDRAEALWALGVLREKRALGPLVEALRSDDEYVRFRAAEGLGWLGDRTATPALETARSVTGQRPLVRDAIDRAIRWIGTGRRPRGLVYAVDAAAPVERTGIALEAHEGFKLEAHGAWAASLDTGSLEGPVKSGDGQRREIPLQLTVGVGASQPLPIDQDLSQCTREADGELVLSAMGPPRSNAHGFITVWIERGP